ncbi:MAG: DNA replication/repair protein RecF [Legionellales bacterium]|nr:DNA replication/repair protein RecF [Legionellales bacterium]
MTITSVNIQSLRNIQQTLIECHPQFNFFYGDNGSGKSSILEAIYLLAFGRSFRHHLTKRLVNFNASQLTLFAEVNINQMNYRLGYQYALAEKASVIKINGVNQRSNIETAKLLPLLLINQDSYQLLNDGPKFRRQFLDWGVFHVEPNFIHHWQSYQKALNQRNSGLKQQLPYSQLQGWDEAMAFHANAIHQYREAYFAKFLTYFQTFQSLWLSTINLSLSYRQGWPKDQNFNECLQLNYKTDCECGYTRLGPHRADIAILVDDVPAYQILSRGQQKVLINVLRLTQGKLLQSEKSLSAIYLLDDLIAELDSHHQAFLLEVIYELGGQAFITSVNLPQITALARENYTTFHVKQGAIVS